MNMNLALSSSTLLLLLLVGFASSNLNQDTAECYNKLIGITYCLPYVMDQANTPPKDCCTGIKEIDHNGKRCLCLLFKDVQFNVLRALKLQGACKTPVNFTQCVGEYQLISINLSCFVPFLCSFCLQFNQSLMICSCRCFAIGT